LKPSQVRSKKLLLLKIHFSKGAKTQNAFLNPAPQTESLSNRLQVSLRIATGLPVSIFLEITTEMRSLFFPNSPRYVF
jgi:hypothetical protein